MSRLFGWIKNRAGAAIDAKHQQWFDEASRYVEQAIREQRGNFNYDATMAQLDAFPDQYPQIAQRAYGLFVANGWKDGDLSPREQQALNQIAKLLRLTPQARLAVDQSAAMSAFQRVFRATVARNDFGPTTVEALQRIAALVGTSAGDLLTGEFRNDGHALLQAMLGPLWDGTSLQPEAWTKLQSLTRGLGISEAAFRSMVANQAKDMVNEAVANAMADGAITRQEDLTIQWMLQNLIADQRFAHEVWTRIEGAKRLQRFRQGHLPSVPIEAAGLRAGEIVHVHCGTTYVRERQTRKGDTRQEIHSGQLIITDARLLFVSSTLNLDVNHRRVVSVDLNGDYLCVNASAKGSGAFKLSVDPVGSYTIYEVAVRKANQTVVQKSTGTPNRHIPRDVRQRVWQLYGGKCAECGATDYIEFDHIIPVAKGGSSTEGNVQLLCRRCNGKKSDAI